MALGQYDVEFRTRTAIKGQGLIDFVSEFTPEAAIYRAPLSRGIQHPNEQGRTQRGTTEQKKEEKLRPCSIYIGDSFQLFVDGSLNRQEAGVGVVLVFACNNPDL
mgnify:CR=1 FL=1